MKKFFSVLVVGTVVSLSAIAQDELKPFKCDVSVGYAIPQGSGSKGGALFAVEPKYAVIPNLSVGLRMEGTIVARFSGYDAYGYPMDASVKASSSFLATADYYFTSNYNFRPFAGIGGGAFLLAGVESSQSSDALSTATKFGGLVRAGIEISHFRVGFEYNLIPKTTFTGYDQNGDEVAGLVSKNSYIGIKIGACFGGGRKD